MSEEVFKPVEMRGPKGGDLTAHGQAFRTKPLQTSILSNGERGFHRFLKDDVAAEGFKDEQRWHRMAAYMLNAGRTNSEIAVSAGVAVNTVSQLRSQRWFQELCATIANENGEELLGAIKSYALDAIEEIASLMRNSDSDSVKLNAARTLVEQTIGKPTQKSILSVSHSRRDPKEEYDDLMRELEALTQQPNANT